MNQSSERLFFEQIQSFPVFGSAMEGKTNEASLQF